MMIDCGRLYCSVITSNSHSQKQNWVLYLSSIYLCEAFFLLPTKPTKCLLLSSRAFNNSYELHGQEGGEQVQQYKIGSRQNKQRVVLYSFTRDLYMYKF